MRSGSSLVDHLNPPRDVVRGVIMDPSRGDPLFFLIHFEKSSGEIYAGFPGGGVEVGESSYHALERELGEELGENFPLKFFDWSYAPSKAISILRAGIPSLIKPAFYGIIGYRENRHLLDIRESNIIDYGWHTRESALMALQHQDQRDALLSIESQARASGIVGTNITNIADYRAEHKQPQIQRIRRIVGYGD